MTIGGLQTRLEGWNKKMDPKPTSDVKSIDDEQRSPQATRKKLVYFPNEQPTTNKFNKEVMMIDYHGMRRKTLHMYEPIV